MTKKFKLSRKERNNLIRIVVSLVTFLIIFTVDKCINLSTVLDSEFSYLLPFFLYLAVYIAIGYDVIYKAIRNIGHLQMFDENFLMCIATLGAFSLALYSGITHQEHIEGFDEACAVLLFYQIGEFFQRYATNKTRKSISSLMDIRPDYANLKVIDENGTENVSKVDPNSINVGDIIVVNPGEKVPLDGIVVKGFSSLDTKALTGESLPREVKEGDEIISGSVNIDSQIEVRVTKKFYDSTVSKILELVENASYKKSNAENFITKFSRFYTPIVCALALLIIIIPGIITSDWTTWIYRGLSFLVVSCPCALVISIPLTFFVALGVSSKKGILVKGSNYLEKMNKANIFVFDKTGTLTKGNFAVSNVYPSNKKEEILTYAYISEQNSSHPIARLMVSKYEDEGYDSSKYLSDNSNINDFVLTNIGGLGIVATDERTGSFICCGNHKLMEKYQVSNFNKDEIEKELSKLDENSSNSSSDSSSSSVVGTLVHVAFNNNYVGTIVISDEIKEESKQLITSLNEKGCQTVMLTGDRDEIAKSVATSLNLTSYKSELLPNQKVEEVEKLLNSKKKNDVLAFVGDGINDAPSLMMADIGISMGKVGSDAAIEASDLVIMNDDVSNITLSKKIAKRTMTIVLENIIFSLVIKVLILILASLGYANMYLAVFGDVGVSLLAILNALRVNSRYLDKPKKDKNNNNKNHLVTSTEE